MPMKRSGRSVDDASRVIEIDDVLVPMIASGLRTGQSWERILVLTSSFSEAVSITRSQSAIASSPSAGLIRSSALCRSLSLINCLETWRAMLPLTVARPDLIRSSDTSLSSTGNPASAHTWAMPLPIWPAPMTPTLRMLILIPLVRIAASSPIQKFAQSCRTLQCELRNRRALATHNSSAASNPKFATGLAAMWCELRVRGTSRSFTTIAAAIPPGRAAGLFAELAEFGRELRQGLVEMRDEPVVGDLENRRLFVLVDRHDDLGVLHAGEMLDRPRYADRDVEFGRHHLPGLADLPVVGGVAGIDRRARGADRRAQFVGNRLDVFGEVFPALHGAPAGDYDFRSGQLGPVGLRQLLAHEARETRD